MQFKYNLHVARKVKLKNLLEWIENYPKKYATPKYYLFMKTMLERGWIVKLHEVRVSKYVFVIKDDLVYKIRFSNHKPLFAREIENDCDYYVGISHNQVSTTEQIIKKLTE